MTEKGLLLIGNDTGSLNIINTQKNFEEETPLFNLQDTSINAVAISGTGKYVVTGGRDPYLTIVDLDSGVRKQIKLSHDNGEVHALQTTKDGKIILIVSSKNAAFYDVEHDQHIHTTYPPAKIIHAAFSPDETGIFLSLESKTLRYEKFPFLKVTEKNPVVIDSILDIPYRAMSTIPYFKLKRMWHGELQIDADIIGRYSKLIVQPYNINNWYFSYFGNQAEDMALFSSLMIEDETPILNDYRG